MSEEKPSLEAVLAHYEVAFAPGRPHQMVSCVFHEDRTPSLSLDLRKELWRCHSCGNGGDSYTMIELKEGTNFVGARRFAASLGLSTGESGGGDGGVSGGTYTRRRSVSGRKGYRPRYRREV